MSMSVRSRGATALAALIALPVVILACDNSPTTAGPEDAPAGLSRAFGIWAPGPKDTCTAELHDQFAVVGPDGKLYPTWHPPVDPATDCTFGHEHGRNPRDSNLFDHVGYVPFGYANEAIDLFAPHPGYKIEWVNDARMTTDLGSAGGALLDLRCDVMVELHQGTAGGGRFVQTQHELGSFVRCNDGTDLRVQFVSKIGHAGEFESGCNDVQIVVDPASAFPDGSGERHIPSRSCVEQAILVGPGQRSNFGALREAWQFSESVRTASGHSVVSWGPYFDVLNPSRYHDPSQPGLVGSTIDLCYEVLADGRRASGGMCEEIGGDPTNPPSWDSERSPFDGAHRRVSINSIRVRNSDGPEVWYTDGYGENARPNPFPGSIRQFISKTDNSALSPHGPSIGQNRPYSGRGVHAPN